MKNSLIIAAAAVFLTACAPVLSRDLMREGTRDVPISRFQKTPEAYKGRLFILGGVIVKTRLTEEGSEIEALYMPVDSSGSLEDGEHAEGRFLALFPKAKGLLDPEVYKKGREVTIAGEFVANRQGKIDEMEYAFPLFEIRQIYLWPEERYYRYPPYYYYPYYPYYYDSPFLYDRWGRPYPNPYWPPPPW